MVAQPSLNLGSAIMSLERLKVESSYFVHRYAIPSVSLRMTNYHQMGVVRLTRPIFLNFGAPSYLLNR